MRADLEERHRLRMQVAEAYGFTLYDHYAEKELIFILRQKKVFQDLSVSTVRRWRDPKRHPKTPIRFIELGGKVLYYGTFIADALLGEADKWEEANSSLESTS